MITLLRKQQVYFSLIALLLILVLSGCSSKSVPPLDANSDLPLMANSVASYDDIELPTDMKQESEKNMSIRNDSFRGGVYYFKGKVNSASLKEFIIVSMQNNKWKLDGENVMKKESFLAFTKPNKTCLMILKEEMRNTKLTLIVTVNSAAAKRLNPFGEPTN